MTTPEADSFPEPSLAESAGHSLPELRRENRLQELFKFVFVLVLIMVLGVRTMRVLDGAIGDALNNVAAALSKI